MKKKLQKDKGKIKIEKQELRKELLLTRRTFQSFAKALSDKKIMEKFLESDLYKKAKIICIYLSTKEEVNTFLIIEKIFEAKKKMVCLRILEENEMILLEVRSLDDLEKRNYSMLEPREDLPEINKKEVDLFVLPGVVFDKKAYRIGRGFGCYDRLLKGLKAKKVGFAYEFQIVDKVPKEKHDVRLDLVLTEENIYPLKNKN